MTSPSHTTPHSDDEPEITQEDAIPSDGKDVEGEQMMKQVRNKKLAGHGETTGETPESQGGKRD